MSLVKRRSGMREVSNVYLISKLLDAATLAGFVVAVMAMNSIGRDRNAGDLKYLAVTTRNSVSPFICEGKQTLIYSKTWSNVVQAQLFPVPQRTFSGSTHTSRQAYSVHLPLFYFVAVKIDHLFFYFFYI